MNRDIYFESIGPLHWPLVAWHLLLGNNIFVFDFTYRLKKMKWLADWIDQGKVERIYIHPNAKADTLAIDAVAWFFERYPQKKWSDSLDGIFGKGESEWVLKKALLEELFRYFYVRIHLEGKKGRLISDSFFFWDSKLSIWCKNRLDPSRSFKTPLWARVLFGFLRITKTIIWNEAMGFITLFHLLLASLAEVEEKPNGDVRQFEHISAIDQPLQVKFESRRKFDFLLDGETLTKNNTLFLVNQSAEGPWIDKAKGQGYAIIRHSEIPAFKNWRGYFRLPPFHLPLSALWKIVAQIILNPTTPTCFAKAAMQGLFIYLTKAPLLARLRFSNYIYTNKDAVPQQWLNALIRKQGGKSWNYIMAIGGGYLYGDKTEFGGRHRFWAYQNPDHYVMPSQAMLNYYKSHPQREASHHNVGSIWSELIVEAQASEAPEVLRKKWFGEKIVGKKVVAWFDTSFIEAINSPSTYQEAIAWYQDILQLTREDDRILSIIKPSKEEAFFIDKKGQWSHPLGEVLMKIWDQLKQNPNIFFAGHTGDPADVIAASDLTITFCFSSPSAEALGAKKRAIWYESGKRWQNSPYAEIPLLVAHGYPQMKDRLEQLLFKMSAEDYEKYLEEKIKGRVEDFLDGKGLSRFRKLLKVQNQNMG
ncbi:MAG: hypothetical protein Q7T03_08420 [Deltaproteobacteria bacterium]|nr:hypothetical protein [Deltaproteobacteria bacterium]